MAIPIRGGYKHQMMPTLLTVVTALSLSLCMYRSCVSFVLGRTQKMIQTASWSQPHDANLIL